ncbi:WAT1-related protein At4g30420-like [Typha angustifolia]|uniref:WAT1-related protein At4g30420-like n=1 Tax=Typha angustifolia TaxID=59011 RepID=UPI003C2B0065
MLRFEKYWKPVLAMVVARVIYAGVILTGKAAFTQGMNPMVFVVYRQAISTLLLAPTTLLIKRRRLEEIGVGVKAFCLEAFLTPVRLSAFEPNFDNVNADENRISNMFPVITFIMAAACGLEEMELRSSRTIAKIVGTIICVGGAMFMTLFKGPKLLNLDYQKIIPLLHSVSLISGRWIKGCLFLTGGVSCWSLWHILQVPIMRSYLDPLSLTTWMGFLSTLQSAILTFFLYPNLTDWKITSFVELLSCLYAGVFGSTVNYYIQSWVISVKDPLFCAMFTPLSTVFTTGFSLLILHQELYIGSLIGSIAVIVGLYTVLWGKAKDLEAKTKPNATDELPTTATRVADAQNVNRDADMEEPLLSS